MNKTTNCNAMHSSVFNLANENLAVTQGEGNKTIPLTLVVNTTDKELGKRGITSTDSKKDGIVLEQTMVEVATFYVKFQLNAYNEFIKSNIKSDYNLDFSGERTLLNCLAKLGEVDAFIMEQKGSEIKNLYKLLIEKLKIDSFQWMKERASKFDLKKISGMIFSLSLHRELFLSYYEFKNERQQLADLNLVCVNSELIKGLEVDALINQAIEDLRKFIEEKYYSLCRVVLDLNTNRDIKTKKLLQYLGVIGAESHLSHDEINEKHMENVRQFSQIGCYIAKLQIFIDLLIKIKQSPRTFENLKIAVEQSRHFLAYYDEKHSALLNFYSTKIKSTKSMEKSDVPYICDFFVVRNYLKNLNNKLQKLHDKLLEAKALASFGNSTVGVSKKAKSKQQQVKKKNQPVHSLQSRKHEVKISPSAQKVENDVENTEIKDAQYEIAEEKVIVENKSEIANEEENIEWEEGELFESFLQMIQSDRKKKLELKEARKIQAKMKIKDEVIESKACLTNINIPAIVKLNQNQPTWDTLFSGKNCHYQLTQSMVEYLIKALGGHVKGVGNGFEYQIFWGDSNKKGGKYEVHHTGANKGELTHEWAMKVRDAILLGIDMGYISKEMLPIEEETTKK